MTNEHKYSKTRLRAVQSSLFSLVLATGISVGAASSAVAQEGGITIDREGDATVRAGEMYEYKLTVRNNADYPVSDLTLKEQSGEDFEVRASQTRDKDGKTRDLQAQASQDENEMSRDRRQALNQNQMQRDQRNQQRGEESGDMRARYADDPSDQRSARDARQPRDARQQGQQQPGSPEARSTSRSMNTSQEQTASAQPNNQWNIGWLAPGESREVTVRGIARNEGSLKSCVSLDYKPSSCADLEVVKPDLALDLQVLDTDGEQRNRFYNCESVILSHQLRNTGSGETRQAVIKPELPSNLTQKQQQQIQVGSLGAGEETREQLVLDQGLQAGTFTVRASAQSGDMTVHSQQKQIEILEPKLEVSIDAPEKEFLGRTLDYAIRVKNTGDAPVQQIKLAVDEPQNLRNVSVSSRAEGETYNIGTLEAGETREIRVRGEASQAGKSELVARASAYCVDEIQKQAAVNLEGIPALVVEVMDNQDPIRIGENTVYDINVKNQGTAEDMNVRISGELPSTLTLVEATGDTEVSSEGGKLNFAPIKSLAPGEVASWQVTAKAEQAGKGQLALNLESSATARPVKETEPTRTF